MSSPSCSRRPAVVIVVVVVEINTYLGVRRPDAALGPRNRTIDDFFSRARIANAQSGTETVLAQERRNDD